MHILHFVTVRAESAQDAMSTVETEIVDYGNENNWRSICGAVSEDNEVTIGDKDGLFVPKPDTTIESINAVVRELLKRPPANAENGLELIKKVAAGEQIENHEWWNIGQYAERQYEVAGRGDDYDILQDEDGLYRGQYDTQGVTPIDDGGFEEEGTKLYVVFVDMHS